MSDSSALYSMLATLLVGWALGSLPLGAMLVRQWTGRDVRDFSVHQLGVENVLRFLGAPAALASLSLDILKGFVAVVATGGSPWAGLGVFVGHLYPLPWLRFGTLPRGRGNGVLLGVLAGLHVAAGQSFWLAAVAVAVFAAVLARTAYVALATIFGLAAYAAAAWIAGPPEYTLVALLLLSIALWRHKAGLARILDGTEPRLGSPPPVRGGDPNVIVTAFMLHPMTIDDLWQPRSQRYLLRLLRWGLLPEHLLRRLLRWMRPIKIGEIRGVRLADGRELVVMLLAGPMLPDQIRNYPKEATRMAIRGATLARELGAEVVGLGAFWSTVGNKGLDVQQAVQGITVTNGGAYTAATIRAAVPGLLASFAQEGGSLRRSTAAVVGANGVVAFGVARMIAGEVAELILIGRDPERLERSAATLARKFPNTKIVVSTDIDAIAAADLVFTATSSPEPVIFPRHVKPGAWIFDLGRPADVDPSVREVPGVHLIPGGVVRPPGEMRSTLDLQFGDGMVPACLAETMILAATGAHQRASLGPTTRTADIAYYLREGERLGFRVITRDERVVALEEAR